MTAFSLHRLMMDPKSLPTRAERRLPYNPVTGSAPATPARQFILDRENVVKVAISSSLMPLRPLAAAWP